MELGQQALSLIILASSLGKREACGPYENLCLDLSSYYPNLTSDAGKILFTQLSERFLLFPIIIQGFISCNVAMSHFYTLNRILSHYKIKLFFFFLAV